MKREAFDRSWPFYLTVSRPCPYIAGRRERKIITKLAGPGAETRYDALSRGGFRRAQGFAYRPSCAGCAACVPVRVVAGGFVPDRSMRKTLRANRHLGVRESPARATFEQYRLFSRYVSARHGDGEMNGMTFAEYRDMVETSPIDTRVVEYRNERGALVAACLVDALDDGYSAVYSFFAPELGNRSLGTLAILKLLERTRESGLPYLYLGYWIAENRKMAYKTRFRPLEALTREGWARLEA